MVLLDPGVIKKRGEGGEIGGCTLAELSSFLEMRKKRREEGASRPYVLNKKQPMASQTRKRESPRITFSIRSLEKKRVK